MATYEQGLGSARAEINKNFSRAGEAFAAIVLPGATGTGVWFMSNNNVGITIMSTVGAVAAGELVFRGLRLLDITKHVNKLSEQFPDANTGYMRRIMRLR